MVMATPSMLVPAPKISRKAILSLFGVALNNASNVASLAAGNIPTIRIAQANNTATVGVAIRLMFWNVIVWPLSAMILVAVFVRAIQAAGLMPEPFRWQRNHQ